MVSASHQGMIHEDGHDDREYGEFLKRVDDRVRATTGDGPVFTTDAEQLFQVYIGALPPEHRKHHTCHACRQFIERFGGLVTIDEHGMTTPVVWNADDAPGYYRPAVEALARAVRRAKVTGIFLSPERVWGQPQSRTKARTWHHFATTRAPSLVFKRATQTAGQAMAEKREDFNNVSRALGEFTQPMIEQALTLLRTDSLYRSEKVIGPAEWLHGLHASRAALQGPPKANVLWRAIATAPAGFCHPRASMVGTLLEDIAAGMDFGDVSRRFAAKMHPLQYQRPQAAPAAGTIAQAEKVIAQLGAAGSLARRFARLEEVEAIWKPKHAPAPVAAGVFGHLLAKGEASAPSMRIPAITMTWEKFARTVLPDADKIEFYARNQPDSYSALVTAVNADAPPILQWDTEAQRNPVSWYFWHGGSTPDGFSIEPNRWHAVNAITLTPPLWGGKPSTHHSEFALFIIEGARDKRMSGAAIFPEILKSEFHGIRSVIEAYSRNAKIEGVEQSTACGIAMQKGSTPGHMFRVTSKGSAVEYRLDRWD